MCTVITIVRPACKHARPKGIYDFRVEMYVGSSTGKGDNFLVAYKIV